MSDTIGRRPVPKYTLSKPAVGFSQQFTNKKNSVNYCPGVTTWRHRLKIVLKELTSTRTQTQTYHIINYCMLHTEILPYVSTSSTASSFSISTCCVPLRASSADSIVMCCSKFNFHLHMLLMWFSTEAKLYALQTSTTTTNK